MSEPHQDSYYEVALSHRQVVWVFVVLLGCVVGAFLAGIWVGQQQETSPAVVMAESGTREGRSERQGRQLEELNFFNDEGATPKPAVVAVPGTTLADDLDAEEAAPSAPPAGPVPEASTPVAAEPAAPAGAGVPSPAPAAPPTGEGLVIQVFSSPDRAQAEQVVERLRGSGHPAFLSPTDVAGKTMFRVRIGPFEERARAERVAESVRRAFRLDTWITQNS